MKHVVLYAVLLVLLSACSEESFRQGGHDMLSGICAKSSNCSVDCPQGQKADSFGHCVPSAN